MFKELKSLDHHAYFIHFFKNAFSHLKDFLKNKFDISYKQNPDFYYEKFEILGIDESRKIKENHLSKSFKEGNKKVFIIECSGITHEAQNSLLKIFEEPNEDNLFFLIMPSIEILLPTLRSRMSIIKHNEENDNYSEEEIKKFFKLSKTEQMDYVDELAKKINNEKAVKRDAQDFLNALESYIYKKEGLKNTKTLKAILKAKDYMNDRSPSIKQLLEYAVLNI